MINLELWKKRKNELHWTLDDLARESGVSRRTIAGIFANDERGKNPTSYTIQAIERALGLAQPLEWTDEERAQGVGRHPTFLSEDEAAWLELRSEVLEACGEEYLAALTELIRQAGKMKNN